MNRPDFRCSTCVFFHQYQRPGFPPTAKGLCRRHAPIIYQDGDGSLRTRFGDNEFRVFDLDGDLDTDFWCQISQWELVRRRAERSQP